MTERPPPARRRRAWLIGAAALLVVLGGFGLYWFGPQHLFVNRTADEAFPVAASPTSSSTSTSTSTATSTSTEGPAATGAAGAEVPGEPTPDETATGDVEVLKQGTFRDLAHHSSGTALLVRLDDGRVFLRLEDLDVLSGPDLRVYLSSAPGDAPDEAFGEQGVVDLGGLRANRGNLTYEIPADVDLKQVNSVSVWCRRFAVGFGVAGLEPAP